MILLILSFILCQISIFLIGYKIGEYRFVLRELHERRNIISSLIFIIKNRFNRWRIDRKRKKELKFKKAIKKELEQFIESKGSEFRKSLEDQPLLYVMNLEKRPIGIVDYFEQALNTDILNKHINNEHRNTNKTE